MAVAAAEQITPFEPIEYLGQTQPLVEAIPNTAEDEFTRLRAEHFIGAVAIEGWQEEPSPEPALSVKPIESLRQAIHEAAEGNLDARKIVETNARTDVIERTIKTGHVMKVGLMVDEAGRIQQHGQSMESVHANSLRFASDNRRMRERTEAETTNAFRIEQHYRQGKLDDYNFVVISRAADNMTKKEMTKAGFFTDTMTCVIQGTTAENEKLTTESAFVSGVKQTNAERHDEQTVVSMAQQLGVDVTGKSAAEIIDTPLLIHKSLMPNGVIDLVEVYDNCAGGTFFGENRPRENYLGYREKCKQREKTYEPKVETIVNDLIEQKSQINTPIEAVRRLHDISEKHMVRQSIGDKSIDPRVFGPVAAEHIEHARLQTELGDIDAARHSIARAEATAMSDSCPSGLKKANGESSEQAGQDKYGSLEFVCPNGHSNTRERDQLISHCKACGVSVKC